MRWLVLILMLATWPARADEIIGAVSQNRVSLTANFSGTEILIFGAIRHRVGEMDADFDVIVTVEGPPQPVEIRRKSRFFGIWVNTDSTSLASVPSFYAVASTAPLNQILSQDSDTTYRISTAQAIRAAQATGDDPQPFTDALLRIRERSGAYRTMERWVYLDRGTLFRANIALPANLTEGAYTTRMYLLRDGEVVHRFRTAIFVRKEGLERWLHQLAYDQPLVYGLLALVIALFAGWGASTVFRLVRN
jgi:uncharacterized protein (TIGR02186 family)